MKRGMKLTRILSPLLVLCLSLQALAADASGEGPSSLYYGDLSLSTTYVTPRGLVVQDTGLVLKTLIGGAFTLYEGDSAIEKIALNTGVYTNFISDPTNVPTAEGELSGSGNIFDIDPYVGFDFAFADKWRLNASYLPFYSPAGFYDAVHNMVILLSYDDTEELGNYSLRPYLRSFTTFSGTSPALLGDTPATYVELGVGPKIPLPGSLGLKLWIPMAVFLADSDYYGNSGTLGTVSSGLLLMKDIGAISVRAGVEYFYLRNENLRLAADILGNGQDASRWFATVGMSFAFAK